MKYAFINNDNVCTGEGDYDPPLVPQPAYAIIIGDDESRLGYAYQAGEWVAVPDTRPAVVVTATAVDEAHADRA